MIEAVFLIFLHILFFPIGYALSASINRHGTNSVAISGIIGYGTITVLSHILYRWGLSISFLVVGFSLLSAASILWIIVYQRHQIKIKSIDVLFYVGALGLLISPAFIGGGQFVIFQGNSYDHFNYLQSAISFQDHDYSYLNGVQIEHILKDPLVEYGSGSLNLRPGVMILYSVVSYWFRGHVLQLPYIYLCFFIAQSILALMWVSRCMLGEKNRWITILVGSAFGIGFWGQYILDQNWWSQISATPLAIILVYEVVRRSAIREQPVISEDFILGVVLTSSFYLYPEILVFLGAGLTIMWFLSFRVSPQLFIRTFGVGVICIGIAALNYGSLLRFAYSQVKSLSPAFFPSVIYGYHGYFIFGKDGISSQLLEKYFVVPVKEGFDFGSSNSIIAEMFDVFSGLCGVFFLTPALGDEPWNAILIRVLVAVFLAATVYAVVQSLRCQFGNRMLRSYLIFLLAESVIVGILMAAGAYYGVLKGYFYLVAVCFPILCLSIATKIPNRKLIVAFLSIQVMFGVVRLHASATPTGIHYQFPPYPSANLVSRKSEYLWDIELYNDELMKCHGIKLTDTFDNGFYEKFAVLLAKQRDIPYFLEGPVRGNYGVGNKFRGYMEKIEYDCIVSQSVGGNPRTLLITKI